MNSLESGLEPKSHREAVRKHRDEPKVRRLRVHSVLGVLRKLRTRKVIMIAAIHPTKVTGQHVLATGPRSGCVQLSESWDQSISGLAPYKNMHRQIGYSQRIAN